MKIYEEEIVDSDQASNAIYLGKINPNPKPKLADSCIRFLKSVVNAFRVLPRQEYPVPHSKVVAIKDEFGDTWYHILPIERGDNEKRENQINK